MHLLAIAFAGGLGALARYSLTGITHRFAVGDFPFGTLLVNTLGCLVLGFITPLLAERAHLPEHYRMGVMIGFLGSFTTFSTFGFDTVDFVQAGQWSKAMLNIGASLLLGLGAVMVGIAIATKIDG